MYLARLLATSHAFQCVDNVSSFCLDKMHQNFEIFLYAAAVAIVSTCG